MQRKSKHFFLIFLATLKKGGFRYTKRAENIKLSALDIEIILFELLFIVKFNLIFGESNIMRP